MYLHDKYYIPAIRVEREATSQNGAFVFAALVRLSSSIAIVQVSSIGVRDAIGEMLYDSKEEWPSTVYIPIDPDFQEKSFTWKCDGGTVTSVSSYQKLTNLSPETMKLVMSTYEAEKIIQREIDLRTEILDQINQEVQISTLDEELDNLLQLSVDSYDECVEEIFEEPDPAMLFSAEEPLKADYKTVERPYETAAYDYESCD